MDETETFQNFGRFEISNVCLESYPCEHYVRFKTGGGVTMGGVEIHCLLKSSGLSDPHFDVFAEFVNEDSPDDIERRKTMLLEVEEYAKQRQAKEETEQRMVVSQTKASSRLNKLKQKKQHQMRCISTTRFVCFCPFHLSSFIFHFF